jgi:hypothetical protein
MVKIIASKLDKDYWWLILEVGGKNIALPLRKHNYNLDCRRVDIEVIDVSTGLPSIKLRVACDECLKCHTQKNDVDLHEEVLPQGSQIVTAGQIGEHWNALCNNIPGIIICRKFDEYGQRDDYPTIVILSSFLTNGD